MIRVMSAAGSVVIDGYPAPIPGGTLQASLAGTIVTISNILGGAALLSADYTALADGGGAGFASAAAAMTYLGGALAIRRQQNYAVAVVDGQTVFPLAQEPFDVNSVALVVNGVLYAAPDIDASALAVTWRGAFPLASDDSVRLTYF